LLLAAVAVGGHVLLEGVPGVAKTLVANAAARALALEFRRVQFTPDMLPSDLTGTMTLQRGELAFRPGPVFTHVLLADEVNRTPPPSSRSRPLRAGARARRPGGRSTPSRSATRSSRT